MNEKNAIGGYSSSDQYLKLDGCCVGTPMDQKTIEYIETLRKLLEEHSSINGLSEITICGKMEIPENLERLIEKAVYKINKSIDK